LTFKAVSKLADAFSESITATAIRLVEADLFPTLAYEHLREIAGPIRHAQPRQVDQ
jgi:hypothetical protein